MTNKLKPVAATIMSASISSPEEVRTPFGKGLQGIRYHGQFAIDRGFEYIGLRTKCEPLLPGSIPGYEVGLELEVVAHITADLVSQHLNHRLGIRL